MIQFIKTYQYIQIKNQIKYIKSKFYNLKRFNWIYTIVQKLLYYKTSYNLSYLWNFGSLAGLLIISQIITGLLLAMWYIPTINGAFLSIEYIMREVWFGWLIRYVHANGASFLFICVYIHIIRNLVYGSFLFPRELVWFSGCLISSLLMAIAFSGYVSPWGQMSFWAATVITSSVSTIPIIGDNSLLFCWGDFGIGQATLLRIYCLHFLLPFILCGITICHLYLLHIVMSNNKLGQLSSDQLPFHPYYTIKDFFGVLTSFSIFFLIICFYPNDLGHPDNYIEANNEQTPSHIVPEWYFLPFYAILRSVPNKLGGVSIVCLVFCLFISLPYLVRTSIQGVTLKWWYRLLCYGFIGSFCIPGWGGQQLVMFPFYEICQGGTISLFISYGWLVFCSSIEWLFLKLKEPEEPKKPKIEINFFANLDNNETSRYD